MNTDIGSVFSDAFVALFISQLLLLPFLASFLWLAPSRLPLAWNLRIQKLILLFFILLPLAISTTFSEQHPHKKQVNFSQKETNAERSSTFNAAIPKPHLQTSPALTSKELAPGENILGENVPEEIALGFTDILKLLSRFFLIACTAGLLVLLARLALSRIYIRQLTLQCEKQTQFQGMEVYHCKDIHSSFSTGGFSPKIFLASGPDQDDRHYYLILKHEFNHIKLHHHNWSLAEQISRYMFWFNPLIHSFSHRGELVRELECDQLTAGKNNTLSYTKALLESAEQISSNARSSGLGTHNWLHRKTLKRRIQMLVQPQTYQRKLLLIPFIVLAMSFILFFYVQKENQDAYFEELALQHIKNNYSKDVKQRIAVRYDEIPKALTQVLLRHEDRDFFDHSGISLRATGRAIYQNGVAWLSGQKGFITGGSTITQQLAKSFLNKERSLSRKMREAKLAQIIEKNYSKEEILEMYLNRVYFGNNAWGLASAANVYFSKPYQDLSLTETAMLIPFLEAPKKYNMIDNPTQAIIRRDSLLAKLK